MIIKKQVLDQVRFQVQGRAYSQAWDQVYSYSQVWDQVYSYSQVWDQVLDQVYDQMEEDLDDY